MKKWVVFCSIIVVLLAVGAGTLYYYLNIKEYKTADSKVDKIVKSDYKIKLPGAEAAENASGAVENATAEKSGATPATAASTTSTSAAVSNKGQASAATQTKTSAPPKMSAASIIAKYNPAFQELESQADGKLNNLLSYAFTEYQTKKANGEDISYFYFYSKYNSAAKSLEASTDSSFNYIYNALVKELESSGYNSNEAKPIRNHYLSVKKQKRSALMDKAVGILK